MTMLNAPHAKIPESSPWHLASGVVMTLSGVFAVMLTINYFVR